jgi:hypothetical protein
MDGSDRPYPVTLSRPRGFVRRGLFDNRKAMDGACGVKPLMEVERPDVRIECREIERFERNKESL